MTKEKMKDMTNYVIRYEIKDVTKDMAKDMAKNVTRINFSLVPMTNNETLC